MNITERMYVTSPDPEYITDGARVAPNEGSFPVDASIQVETESHFLAFDIEPKSTDETEYAITLIDAIPPLMDEAEKVIVEGDVLIKDREFILISQGKHIAAQAFRAVRIQTNVEQIVIPPRGRAA